MDFDLDTSDVSGEISWDRLDLSHSLPLVLGGWQEDNTTLMSMSSKLSERPSLTSAVLLPIISDQLLAPALGSEGWGFLSREVSLWLSERLVFYLSVHLEQLSSPDNFAKSPCLSWMVQDWWEASQPRVRQSWVLILMLPVGTWVQQLHSHFYEMIDSRAKWVETREFPSDQGHYGMVCENLEKSAQIFAPGIQGTVSPFLPQSSGSAGTGVCPRSSSYAVVSPDLWEKCSRTLLDTWNYIQIALNPLYILYFFLIHAYMIKFYLFT